MHSAFNLLVFPNSMFTPLFFFIERATCQSAYRPGHSNETALLKVVNDLFLSLNKGNISVLALLDFSSAFDTIDHSILVHVYIMTLDLLILSFNGFHLI